MYNDYPLKEILPRIEELVAQGANVYIKWTCPRCGDRCTADEPNAVYMKGYLHTAREDGTPCGGTYDGDKFNYLAIMAFGGPEQKGVDNGNQDRTIN